MGLPPRHAASGAGPVNAVMFMLAESRPAYPGALAMTIQTSGSAGRFKSPKVGIGSMSFWINVFDQRTEVS